jgi:RNA recognition motif-containing protein
MADEETFPWEGRILTVKNLSYTVCPTDLRDFFLPVGKLLRVDIERGKDGGSNGLAYVEFASAADCKNATALQGSQFQGRTMKCEISTRPPPELTRFYIRSVSNRPINDRIRQRIIDEARGIVHEPKPMQRRERGGRRRRRSDDSQSDSDDEPLD